VCAQYAQRVQESVYLAEVDAAKLIEMQGALARVINHHEDTVRYYPVSDGALRRSAGLGVCQGLRSTPDHWLV
jgi:CRISPR-associated endonuclease Cas2